MRQKIEVSAQKLLDISLQLQLAKLRTTKNRHFIYDWVTVTAHVHVTLMIILHCHALHATRQNMYSYKTLILQLHEG